MSFNFLKNRIFIYIVGVAVISVNIKHDSILQIIYKIIVLIIALSHL